MEASDHQAMANLDTSGMVGRNYIADHETLL